jgi:isopenicillin N synthase-like dioxygenase
MLDVIDLKGLGSHDPAAVRRVAAELGRACRDVGFFYVRNHGVPDALLSGIFRCSEAFFTAPQGCSVDHAVAT